jgi:hypothetical protein
MNFKTGFIDNKWVNFYYDAKNDVLQYNLDEYCPKGEHILKLIVTDKVGNKSIINQKSELTSQIATLKNEYDNELPINDKNMSFKNIY